MKNIIATFPAGVDTLAVNGLHQWDYGRQLEIHSSDLPAIVEVHFACQGMPEAVVRVCDTVDNVAVAVIPDQCLEQTSPVTAWVYLIDDTAGATTKTVTLTVTPRTKPQPRSTVPTSFSNLYTEALAAMNEAVAGVKDGSVVPGKALHAETAGTAATAAKATEADWALSADSAAEADQANKAGADPQDRTFVDHYLHVGETTKEGWANIIVETDKLNLFHIALDYADGATVLDLGVVGIDPTRGDRTVWTPPALAETVITINNTIFALLVKFTRVGALASSTRKDEWNATLYEVSKSMTLAQYTGTAFVTLKVTPLISI